MLSAFLRVIYLRVQQAYICKLHVTLMLPLFRRTYGHSGALKTIAAWVFGEFGGQHSL